MPDTYERLIVLLDDRQVACQVLVHLAILPGNRRVDLARLSATCGARSATLAPAEVAAPRIASIAGVS